jgi:glycosyltransferase involved in cell wall biosynthesis
MRIAFDFSAFIPQSTGVDTYMKQLVLHLAKVDQENQYLVCLNLEDRHLFGPDLPENFSCTYLSARPRPLRLIYQQSILPVAALAWRADIVHSPAFIMPFIRGTSRHVLTIHDMTSFSHPECHNALRRSASYQAMVKASMRRADTLIVPSQATRQAALDFMPDLNPDDIKVTSLGIGDEFRLIEPGIVQEATRRLKLPRRYVLFVGTLEPRKNLAMLVESYRQLAEAGAITEHLVIAGKLGWGYEALLKQISEPALKGKVHLMGYLDQKDLPAVYAGARLFIYPSLFEGFGFPPLEAMACGVPTISTLSSSLIENLRGAAELVPPDSVEALAEAMSRLLSDKELWTSRREQGLEHANHFRWKNTARETIKCYQATLATDHRGSAHP